MRLHQRGLASVADADLEFVNPRRMVSAVATPLQESEHPAGVLAMLQDLTGIRRIEDSQREFVSNVSHELKNSPASIKAMVETLEDGAIRQSDIASDFLLRILREINRMTGLSNDLLELSQLEAGQRLLDLGPVDLSPMAQEVQSQFQEAAASKGIQISIEAPENPVLALGGRSRLHQVLVNLVENAVKFANNGEPITLMVREGGVNDSVEVGDTGPGISREDLPFILSASTRPIGVGRTAAPGLGLAIVKRVVTAHGGEVQVESSEGEGSTFRATLPKAGVT